MNMGRAIRANRLRCNLTQERLAQALGVTAQAVSRWESGQGCPDIALLPELSAMFGVSIDELFERPDELHLRRIEAMVERESMLSRADFDYAMARTQEGAKQEKYRGRCLTLLSELCLQRSRGYADMAADYAKQALEAEPEKKANHSLLCNAKHGVIPDWCCSNHTELIDYYKGFVSGHPDYAPGYLWLMDNLIGDGRLDEARQALEKMAQVRPDTYHIPMYRGWIEQAAGHHELAGRIWDQMVVDYADSWFAWSCRADVFARQTRYDEAIAAYRKSIGLQTPQRFTDNELSIAQISMIREDWRGAIEACEHVLAILREDWGITEGEVVEDCLDKIRTLNEKL